MSIEVGTKVDGKVSGITNFGAFVDLGEHRSGLVHISEVSDSFVKDIHSVLKVGDSVTVKVLSIADDGKIALSIRKAVERPAQAAPKKSHEYIIHETTGNSIINLITKQNSIIQTQTNRLTKCYRAF